jgi:hypothetical protein
MAMPISACFRGWGVVHPITSHGHNLLLLLQSLHNPQLVLWGNTGIDPHILHRRFQLSRGEFF